MRVELTSDRNDLDYKEHLMTLSEVKHIQLEILDYIDNVCKKNNIEYWLDGGSLIGAVRHSGYIPWDDDIDIIIRRKDYDKALQLFDEYSTRFRVLSFKKADDYYYPFGKVVDTHTKLIEKGIKPIHNMGVYVDVFPLDFIPTDKKDRERFYDTVFRYRSMVYYSTFTFEQFKNATLLQKTKSLISKIYGWKRALIKLDCLCRKASNEYTEYMMEMIGVSKKYIFVHKEVFEDTLYTKFEGINRPIPIGYDKYLTASYGNYMELPPEDSRVLKHDFRAYRL